MKSKHLIISILFLLNFSFDALSTSIDAWGSITGNVTWDTDTVRLVSDISIQNGAVLTIAPGTRVEAHGMYKIEVKGAIVAIGTPQEKILFTSADTTDFYATSLNDGGWKGIHLNIITNANDSTLFSNCIVEFTKRASFNNSPASAIQVDFCDRVRFSDCIIRDHYYASGNSGGLFLIGSSPIIINNYFTNNNGDQGGAIALASGSAPLIDNNIFFENFATRAGGAIMSQASFPIITNNYICNNSTEINNCGPAAGGAGIRCTNGTIAYIANNVIANNDTGMKGGGIECLYGSNSIIENNTIVNNNGRSGGGAIYLFESNPEITNNIMWGNTRFNNVISNQVSLFTDDSDPTILNSCIEGDSADFMNGASGTYTGIYLNNISTDPMFISPSLGSGIDFDGFAANWQLQESSPCIDAGTNSVNPSMPQLDLSGTARISGTIDMGAYERFSETSSLQENQMNLEIRTYPNPVSKELTVIAGSEMTEISIVNSSGKTIEKVYPNNKTATINTENLEGGIYYLKIISNFGVVTNKITKL